MKTIVLVKKYNGENVSIKYDNFPATTAEFEERFGKDEVYKMLEGAHKIALRPCIVTGLKKGESKEQIIARMDAWTPGAKTGLREYMIEALLATPAGEIMGRETLEELKVKRLEEFFKKYCTE